MKWFRRQRPRYAEAEQCRQRAERDLLRVYKQREEIDSTLQKAHAAVSRLDAFAREVDQAFKLRRRST